MSPAGKVTFAVFVAASHWLATGPPTSTIHHWYHVLLGLGGVGLLILSTLDSSPLSFPLGNDLMMIALTAREHNLMLYYALMATAGSTLGCATVELLARKGGEEGFERLVGRKRFKTIGRRVKKNGAWALAIASLLPPPFPFTPVVAGAAAFQYPRKNALLVLSASRFARFLIEGILAIVFGRRLLRLARSPLLGYVIAGVIVVSLLGSALAIRAWIKAHRAA